MQISNLDLNILKPIFDFELFKVRRQDKEDVKQAAILRILESMQNYSTEELPENKLFSFAQVIVKRTVVDYYRRQSRKIEADTNYVNFCDDVKDKNIHEGSQGTAQGADTFSISVMDNNYQVADIRVDYQNNSHLFTPKERMVIEYMLFNEEGVGMNLTEISEELGVHKARATKAMQKLREVCADRY